MQAPRGEIPVDPRLKQHRSEYSSKYRDEKNGGSKNSTDAKIGVVRHTWGDFCCLPSASKSAVIGNDGGVWGENGGWNSSTAANRKLAKINSKNSDVNATYKIGKDAKGVAVNYHINGCTEGVLHGYKGDTCVVIKHLSKCFLAAIGPKSKQETLIDEINAVGGRLKEGGY